MGKAKQKAEERFWRKMNSIEAVRAERFICNVKLKDSYEAYNVLDHDEYQRFIKLVLKNTDTVCFKVDSWLDDLDELRKSKWGMLSENVIEMTDENGEKHEYSSSIGVDDITVEVKALSDSEAEQLSRLVKTATTTYSPDNDIYNIIEEEAGAYYEDQKSVEEVASIIQSRVSIYLSENS